MTPVLPEVEAVIVELTNAFRAEQKLGAVKRDAALDRAARAYATTLARSTVFSHTADGRSFSDRIKAAGYAACGSAENLALNGDSRGFATRQLARDAVEGWKQSPGHRKNMMVAAFTEIGVGVAKKPGEHTYLSVQLFGRPASLNQVFRIENRAPLSIAYALDGKSTLLETRTTVTHTRCAPAEIVVAERAGYTLAPRAQRRFQSQHGDHFVIEPLRDGMLTVRHIPRTR